MPQGNRPSITEQLLIRGQVNTCPVCNGTNTRGGIITPLSSGAASSTSVLATHHLDRLPATERKILIFADNRQEAAHQAGYMGDRHRQFAIRHAIDTVVRGAGKDGLALNRLSYLLLEKLQAMRLVPPRLAADERKDWELVLEMESAGEFCRATHQRISLENLAMIEVEYEFLDEMVRDPKFLAACERTGIPAEDGTVLVRAMLDRMRRSRAVGFSFFQKYLDPGKLPWLKLIELYQLAIPEREKGPQFFMMDRPEAARHAPSGYRFNAIAKDSDRGALPFMPKLVKKAFPGMATAMVDDWIRQVFDLLRQYEILEVVRHFPARVASAAGRGLALQIAPRVVRLYSAEGGYRCQRCRTWKPYRGKCCYQGRCSGEERDLLQGGTNLEGYYESLYRSDAPRRMRVEEHTAQIDEKDRADRETQFKKGWLDVLVCSPTLELGVDIGDLLTVLLRNSPPTPANYIQRAGRAGRRLRIGFVSTYCGIGAHDRHCFENPAWLVRGEFRPPIVKLENDRILARHVRALALEECESQVPGLMGEFVDNLDKPGALHKGPVEALKKELSGKSNLLAQKCQHIFDPEKKAPGDFFSKTCGDFPSQIDRMLEDWFVVIQKIFEEWQYFDRITAGRHSKQKARARERAYREMTGDRNTAYVLTYMANDGLLPSYQFPTDTFSLDPGVSDTPSLRRPAWIALFEFAPGNLVYANGHKLKSIRAFFEGRNRAAPSSSEGGLGTSGRVRSFCFCDACGYAAEETKNECPVCGKAITLMREVAFIEAFEAEENTQITSAEEARQRINFERKEHLIPGEKNEESTYYPYPFAKIEHQRNARLLVSNWGRKVGPSSTGEMFRLCPNCGKHKPSHLTDRNSQRWDDGHAALCQGELHDYLLGYEFNADILVVPIAQELIDSKSVDAFCRTLGTALIGGAVELLEVEPDEIAFFYHPVPQKGAKLFFYETVPGGAGYLTTLASQFPKWANASLERLTNHQCAKACYQCLKNYRNQFFHTILDKTLIQSALFQFASADTVAAPYTASSGKSLAESITWINEAKQVPTENTVIEQKLLEAILGKGRLPKPVAQRQFHKNGSLITIADFGYESEKIAIYCDGYAYHANKDSLAKDATKRNELQADGWLVLTFWGKTILKHPERCEEQIWKAFRSRQI